MLTVESDEAVEFDESSATQRTRTVLTAGGAVGGFRLRSLNSFGEEKDFMEAVL